MRGPKISDYFDVSVFYCLLEYQLQLSLTIGYHNILPDITTLE